MCHVQRSDHVGITVTDLDMLTAFFVGLGLEVEGTRMFVEGQFLDTVIGIPDSRTEIVMLRPPDGGTRLMLRPLLDDVEDDDMCGVTVNQVFPANEKWHPLLLRALSGIPHVKAGDSVWWHADVIHSVAPVQNQQGWGNVMYIPAAPWCPRNETYAATVREASRTGSSPSDFPDESYEQQWANRFHETDLNDTGRRGLGIN